jgi:hypothetical protein
MSRPSILALVVALNACSIDVSVGGGRIVIGSGTVVEQHVDVAGVTAITVANAFEVDLTIGGDSGAVLEVDEEVVDVLDVRVTGDTLHIGLEENVSVQRAVLRAIVTLPQVTAIEGSGASRVTVGGESVSGEIGIELSGASSLTGLDADGADLEVSLSGAATATVAGTAASLRVDASGGSRFDGEALIATDARVDLSGGSQAVVEITGDVVYDLSGGSLLRVLGEPASLDGSTSGGARLERG